MIDERTIYSIMRIGAVILGIWLGSRWVKVQKGKPITNLINKYIKDKD